MSVRAGVYALLGVLPLLQACGDDTEDTGNGIAWCTADWVCDVRSGAVSRPTAEGCPASTVPAICLDPYSTDIESREVFCHDQEEFEPTCLYETVCSWNEDLELYLIECDETISFMP
ncbi:MAG: hypothetical protein H6739_09330 [Alphaproteobacteria bacterium]|nr:hypothetical protein [Alphaproteobacteria bacterium]